MAKHLTATEEQAREQQRDELVKLAFPVALADFYRTGGAGEVWDDYDDLAESCYNAADAMLRARKKRRS
jgi:hypothetical protein